MIVVHHLNNSRSQRIVWLLEELGVPYKLEQYKRDARTNLAPPELRAVHPLGKSPVIEDGDLKLSESGAIVEYLIERHGKGRLSPARGTPEHIRYLHWMHFAEGTIMLHLLARLYLSRVGEPASRCRRESKARSATSSISSRRSLAAARISREASSRRQMCR